MRVIRKIGFLTVLALFFFSASSISFAQEGEKTDYSKIKPLINLHPELEGTYADYLATLPNEPYTAKTMDTGVKALADGTKVLVMVNASLKPNIESRLDRYINDLENNGYSPIFIEVSGGTHIDVKNTIKSNSSSLAGVVFVGNFPVAWFEMDDDFSGYASFPCDYFYMDLNGTWADNDGDGMFDSFTAGTGDQEPEIYLGRIDASRMSADEITLTRHYFDKLHDYYISALDGTNYGLSYVEDDWQNYSDINNDIRYAYPDYQNIAGTRTTINTERNDYLYNRLKSNTYEYIQLCCHSWSGGCSFTRGGSLLSSTVIAELPQALFYNFFNCSGARFTDTDYFGGAHIFNMSTKSLGGVGSTKTGSMLSFWAFYQPLGAGKSHGQAFKEWFAYIAPFDLGERQWHFGMTLIGDPFLAPKKTYENYGLGKTAYPKFQYDNQNSGFLPATPVITAPGLRWQFSLGNITTEQKSSPVIGEDGTIYVGSNASGLTGVHAITPDGFSKWYLPTDGVLATPSIDTYGCLYFATWNGTNSNNIIYRIRDDISAPTILWQVATDGGDNVLSSVALSDTGEVIYGTGISTGQMIGLNAVNGSQKWKQAASGGIGGSPALILNDDRTVFVSSESKKVYLLRTTSGVVCDTFDTESFMWAPTPCVGKDGTIYVGDSSGTVYALTVSNDTLIEKWRANIGGAINGGVGAVYQKDGRNRLYAMANGGGRIVAVRDDNTIGTILWDYNIGNGSWTYNTPNIVFNGTIYVGSTDSNVLYALKDKDTHAELAWQFSAGDATKRITGKGMAIDADGTIYCNSEDGNLYAIEETAIPSVTLTYPNGGNMLMRGATTKIRWEFEGNALQVKIDLYKGGSWFSAITESTLNTGEYNWTIPDNSVLADDYRIKITDLNHANVSDFSDADFSITSAAHYFVSLDGSDETGTGRQESPWRTIQYALINAPSGKASEKTIIHVGEGVFVEHSANNPDSPDGLIFPYEGNPYGWDPKNYIKISGAGMDKTVIMTDADNQTENGEAKVVYLNGSNNEIENVTIRHGIPQTGEWGAGIWCERWRCKNNLIKKVRLDNVGRIGICANSLDSNAGDIIHIEYVLINGARYAGIFTSGNINTCIAHHLTIVDGLKNGGEGNGVVCACKTDISYSIFANNNSALKTIGTGTINSVYDNFWQNNIAYDEGEPGGIPVRLYETFADPYFFNPYGKEFFSFYLVNNSPAQGKGFAPYTITDSDGDGMPDFYEDYYGFDKNNPLDADENADGDIHTNLEDYYAGTDPLDADSFFKVIGMSRDESGAPVIEWTSIPGMRYAVIVHTAEFNAEFMYDFQSTWQVYDLLETDNSKFVWSDPEYDSNIQKYYSIVVYGRE